ncbi:MAG: 5-formyltetrahydrofolate cyclo-ligase [Oscillospiraceae bacterium]
MAENQFDIRSYKKNLRTRYRGIRASLDPQQRDVKNGRILRFIQSMPAYQDCKLLLCFVSTPQEVDTRALIEAALAEGKRVAVPYCIDGTREMEFYEIESLSELQPRTFGVLEPDPASHKKVTSFRDALCILPGLSFDRFGYRLGYGGGYYDRFLSHKFAGSGGVTAGICFRDCMRSHIVHGRYDVPADYIVTENGVRKRLLRDSGNSLRRRDRSVR